MERQTNAPRTTVNQKKSTSHKRNSTYGLDMRPAWLWQHISSCSETEPACLPGDATHKQSTGCTNCLRLHGRGERRIYVRHKIGCSWCLTWRYVSCRALPPVEVNHITFDESWPSAISQICRNLLPKNQEIQLPNHQNEPKWLYGCHSIRSTTGMCVVQPSG